MNAGLLLLREYILLIATFSTELCCLLPGVLILKPVCFKKGSSTKLGLIFRAMYKCNFVHIIIHYFVLLFKINNLKKTNIFKSCLSWQLA